ncbi:hypothetical protein K439DRAFT_1355833, partial [Ramaria rubella]
YLEGLKALFPAKNFTNNNHIVLHLEEMLVNFGPVHSWWTFPFEWLIGWLVRISTNWKIGEIILLTVRSF